MAVGQIITDNKAEPDLEAEATKALPDTNNGIPYTIYSKRQKIAIILAASVASFFSPMSANIYLPALNSIAKDLNITSSLINLTLTTYLVRSRLRHALGLLLTRSLDLPRTGTYFCWRLFGFCRPATGIHHLHSHLPRCQHWTGYTGQLRRSTRFTMSAKQWKQRDCCTCQRRRCRRHHFIRKG
jgi:hypothetical protein